MADIRLAKPAAGASESVQCAPDARFVFDFPTTDATLAREGDNLNISFQDGSQLQLQGFYQEYNGENLPSFNIDGTEVAAADFFQAMNEPDLMPAAGPGTGTVANGARFHEWGDSSLAAGITHLNGLDWGFSRSFEWEDHPNAVGYDDDGWRGAANTVPDLDVPAAPERPYDPRNPGDDPNNPASPQNPGGYIPNTHGASIVVDEGALAKGSGQHVLHGVHDYGSFVADVHAERGGSIELSFGGKVVTLEIPRDGSLRIAPSGDASFANVNGVDIRILGAQSTGDGKWVVRYEYRLGDHIDHDKLLGQDTVRYDGEGIAITVTDGSGDVTRGRITVEVHDDVPLLRVLSAPAVIRDSATDVTAKIAGLSFGADDEDAKTLTINVKNDDLPDEQGVTYTYAIEALPGGGYKFTPDEADAPTLDLKADGSYTLTYTRPGGHAQEDGDVDATANTYTFTVTVTDSDGDAVGREVTVTTKPAPFIIVGPDPDPDPNPNPNPDPDNPDDPDDPELKVADMTTAASMVVTDDSYLPRGNPGQQGLEDDALSNSASASSSFGLLLNGLDYTLTIKGNDEQGASKTLTIELNADGSFKSFSVNGGASSTDAGSLAGEKLWGEFGEINDIHITPPQPGGNQSLVSYTYTQTQPFSHKHDDPADQDNTADESMDAETFGITLNDGLHDEVKSFIQVQIEDDTPEAGVLTVEDKRPKKTETADDDANAGGAEVSAAGEGTGDDTPHAAIEDSAGTITALLRDMTFGADNGKDKTLTITVVKEVPGVGETSSNYEYTIAQQGDHYTFTPSQPSEGDPKGGNAPTLVYDSASGGYKLTYTRDETEREDTKDKPGEFGAESDTYTFTVKVTDADGDMDQCSVVVSTIPEPLIIQGPKPGPEPTPDPNPDPNPNPDPDPKPDPVVADMKTAASWVVTDDSYLPRGNPGQQGLEDDALSNSASASSSFDLKLNGLEYTLTIEGKESLAADAGRMTLTIKLTAEGKVDSFSVSVNDITIETPGKTLADVELYGAYGKISGIGVQPDGGNQSQVSYTYTQEKAFGHTDTDSKDELSAADPDVDPAADQFKITLDDHMHDPKSSFIRVDIEDDAPEAGVLTVTNKTSDTADETTPPAENEDSSGSEGASPTEGTVPPPAEIKDSDGDITALLKGMTFGADNGDGKKLTITVAKEEDESGSKSFEYTIDVENGQYTFTPKEAEKGVAPTLEYDDNNEAYKLTYHRPDAEREDDDRQDATSNTYTFTVKVTDADGDVDDCSVTVTTRPGVFIIPDKNPETDDKGNKIDGVASRVTTDDSYLNAGTKQPPKAAQREETAAQAASDEVNEGESAPASSAEDGLSHAASADSNFILQLNGRVCTLTIKGASVNDHEKADTLKIVLNEDGHLTSYTYTNGEGETITVDSIDVADSLAKVELAGTYGNISGITLVVGTSERMDIPTVQVSYNYTQTDPYSHTHENSDYYGRPDELSPASPPAEEFALTLSDGLHDPVHSSIKVDIEDDEPLAGSLSITNEESIVGQPDAEGVPHAEIKDSESTITARLEGLTFGADDGEGKSVTITVEHAIKGAAENVGAEGEEAADADVAATAETGDEGATANLLTYTYTAKLNADGGYSFECTDDDAPDLEYAEDGSYTLTYTRPDMDVEQANQIGATGDEYTFTVKVKDADGDVDQCSVTVSTTPQQLILPGPDPNPTTPASTELAASTVVTDDSYVKGGTYFGKTGYDGGDGKSNFADSSFGLQLNGRECTLTITGKQSLAAGAAEKKLTIVFDEDGGYTWNVDGQEAELGEVDGQEAGLGKVELFGSYGKISGISIVDGKVHYTYTQTKPYEHKHTPGEDNPQDEKAKNADSFALSLSDGGMHDTVNSVIRVDIEDDEPVVHVPSSISLAYIEGGTVTPVTDAVVQGEFDYTPGADGATAVYSLEVVKGSAPIYAKTVGGEWQLVTLTSSGDTVMATLPGETLAFTLKIDNSGNVKMTTEPNIAIKHNNNGAALLDGTQLDGVKAVLTVTDGDGDIKSDSRAITITIADTKATFKSHEPQHTDFNQEEYGTALSIDFTTATFGSDKEIEQYGSLLRGYKAGHKTINIFGTHVAYNLNAGTVVLLEDQVEDFQATGTMHKYLPLKLSNQGLGVQGKAPAAADSYEDLGVGRDVVSHSSRTQTDYHSEGVVIEPANGTVNYGLTLTLSDFDGGERAIVAFYLTPQNNNDNSVVRYVELHAEEDGTHYTYEDGKYVISVPDGFTKCIIAPIPTAEEVEKNWSNTSDTDSKSQFAIAKIEFTQPSVTHTGMVEWVENVDGVKSLTWDWSTESKLAKYFAGGVDLPETLGAGHYEVTFQAVNGVENAFEAILSGGGGAYSQNGRTLFTATLDMQEGKAEWKIEQFYKFTLSNGDAPREAPIEFTITDGDGSTTSDTWKVNLHLESIKTRFDRVDMGAYNKAWGGYACRDNVYDVLQGEGVNDLMYGRGGNDILFGDNLGEQGFAAFAKALFGPLTDKLTYTTYDNPDAPAAGGNLVDKYAAGANSSIVTDIYKKLDSLISEGWNNGKRWNEKNFGPLDEVVKLAEGIDGKQGDDALFGGVGNDILFGGAGDDYLVGTGNLADAKGQPDGDRDAGYIHPGYEDSNMLFGGKGRDILVYNKADKIVDGGEDIDILLMGKKDWEEYEGYNGKDEQGASLNRLLLHTDSKTPVVMNIELLLISKNTNFVEQLGITSQESLAAYGIVIMGNTVTLDEKKWHGDTKLHSSPLVSSTDPCIDRYYNTEHDLYLDVLRDGKVRLLDSEGNPFDEHRARDDDPQASSAANEASVMSLMNEDSAVVMASDAPEEGESVTQAAFDPAQEEAPTPEQPATEATPADIVETRETFLDRVTSLGGSDEDVAFGTGGGDYLDSADDSYVFADAGDDLIVYDPTDYLIDGGTGIDFLLSESSDPDHSLAAMLDNWEQNGAEKGTPMVHDVEVMLKGVNLSLQNMEDLADKYGFTVKHVGGKDVLELKKAMWEEQTTEGSATEENGASRTTTYKFKGNQGENGADAGSESPITLETTLTATAESTDETIVLTQIVTTSQG